MGLFTSLNTGVSGMSAAKNALATTSHNISNANTEYYTRQKTTNSANYTHNANLNTGLGVSVDSIVRLHDEFVYTRLKSSSEKLEYSTYTQRNLEEVAKYFPDLQKVGIKNDLENYFNAWNDFSSNTSEGSQKINLITSTQTLASNLHYTRAKIRDVQDSINQQLKIAIDEVNSLGEKIANINKEIVVIEGAGSVVANDLRDQRDQLEMTLSKLVNTQVYKGKLSSDTTINSQLNDGGEKYNINIAGFSFVTGGDFNPIVIKNDKNVANYYSLYHEREDEKLTDMTSLIQGGKIGAMLDLRGRNFDENKSDAYPVDGILQGYIDDLDTFAKTMMFETNNIYAQVAQENVQSSYLSNLDEEKYLTNYDSNIKVGEFDVIVYNAQGEEVAKKSITIQDATSMEDIVAQFNANTDDNGDNDTTNDVNDIFEAKFNYSDTDKTGFLKFERQTGKDGYTIAIKDNGTNFPGIIGINNFFEGTNAQDISVASRFANNPDSLQGHAAPITGNNDVANTMVQLQYEQLSFERTNGTVATESIESFYRFLTSNIATDAESSKARNDTNMALFQTVNSEFQSVSGVNLDEELSDLMKFQTAYSSNAKVLTTIDKMLDALLGIR